MLLPPISRAPLLYRSWTHTATGGCPGSLLRSTWMPVLISAGLTHSTTSGRCHGLSAAPSPKVSSCRMRERPIPPEPMT